MAAEATFTLRAVDATKQAFASVQNSLQNIKNSAQTVSRNFATSFGFQAAITAARKLNQVMKDAEETGTRGGLIDKDTLDGIQIYNDLIKTGSENFQYSVGKTIGFFQDAFSYTKQLFTGQEKLTNSQKAQNIALDNAKVPLGIINEKLTQQVIQNELINAGDNQILDNLKEQVQAIINKGKMSDDIVFKKQAELDAAIATGQVLSMEKKMAEDQKNSLKESKKLHDDLNASIGIEFDVTQRSNELLKERALLNEKIYFMDKTSSKGKDDAKELKKQRDDISKDLIPLLEKRYTLEKQIGEVVGQNFQNAILEGGKAIDVVKAMVKEIISLIFYQMVTRRIASGITGLLIGNPLVGSIVGEPLVSGAKAGGGPVGFGKSYLVGERGPELFVPHASGSIVSNSNMNQGGGSAGSSINVSYNIAAGVTRNELAPILEQERRRLKAEIPDMVRRGGAYRSAFA